MRNRGCQATVPGRRAPRALRYRWGLLGPVRRFVLESSFMWMQPPAAQILRESPVASLEQPLGDQLKTYFDNLTAGPAPDRLLRLTEALEAAFERGELQCGGHVSPQK